MAVVPTRPLGFLFLLYVIRWSYTCVSILLALRAILTESTISAASFLPPAKAPSFLGRRILLSISVKALTGPGNSAAAVRSSELPCTTVIIFIFLLSLYYRCTGIFNAAPAAAVTTLNGEQPVLKGVGGGAYVRLCCVPGGDGNFTGVGSVVRAACSYYFGVYILAAVAVTLVSEILRSE